MVTNKYFENVNKSIMLSTNFFEKKRDLFFKIKSKCYVLVNIFKNKFNKNENKYIHTLFRNNGMLKTTIRTMGLD